MTSSPRAGSSSPAGSSSQPSGGPIIVNIEKGEIEISDDEEELNEDGSVRLKRKLTSKAWHSYKRVRVDGQVKAKCLKCGKLLGGETKNGTSHLLAHNDSCAYSKAEMNGKMMAQSSLRFAAKDGCKVSLESYVFDQDFARKALISMIILHEYPLCMVDHAGFRRFVSALQPKFKLVTRNTIRSDIIKFYKEEAKKAIKYMATCNSRVAITTDMWTSDNQKKGYMVITTHFIDDGWNLRSVVMRFIYVPAPHTADIIAEELAEALVEWNLDEKLSTVTVDNCTSNDKAIELLVKKLGSDKLMLQDTKNFNVLDWWKVAGTRYPTLRLIARDIYAIPISTVASESTFSTSGRVLSEHRSRLTSDLLEALMCSQDWIRNRYKDDDNGQQASFWSVLEDIEEGLQGLTL